MIHACDGRLIGNQTRSVINTSSGCENGWDVHEAGLCWPAGGSEGRGGGRLWPGRLLQQRRLSTAQSLQRPLGRSHLHLPDRWLLSARLLVHILIDWLIDWLGNWSWSFPFPRILWERLCGCLSFKPLSAQLHLRPPAQLPPRIPLSLWRWLPWRLLSVQVG